MILISDLVLAGIAVLVVILLMVLLFILIKVNVKKYHEENDVINDKTLSKIEMEKAITSYIKKVGRFGDFSLIYLDIDNFTNTNDIFGKAQCDEFLVEITQRLVKRLPYRTIISKYNRDEFLICIKENLNYEQVCKVADTLLNDIRGKLYVSSNESINLTASAGVCLYPSCGKTTDDLIKNLELATYISKREGGNKYTVYYSSLRDEETSNFKFFQEVKAAILNKEFCLYYQPIVNLEKNEVFAFEALMRWNHPEQGILAPAKFINIMEQSGDIYWVGVWGLELACKKIQELSKVTSDGEARVSINLSTKQLTYEKLADDLILIAKKASVDAKNIILEISGYTMFDKMENVKPNLLKLRDNGFTIAVDGFELDYSTIARIQKEPIDIIKLDRTFLENITDNQIKENFVKMLVDNAALVNRRVVAEGIENEEALDYVKNCKITFGQGYYYSKPMPDEEVLDFVRFRKWEKEGTVKPEVKEEPKVNEEPEIVNESSTEEEVLNENNDVERSQE